MEKKRESIDTSDEKTGVQGTTPLSEQRKINETASREILDKYITESDDVRLENLNKEDFTKIKGLVSILGIPSNIKRLGAFRKYFKPIAKK